MSRRMAAGFLTFLMLMSVIAAFVDLSVGTASAGGSSDFTYSPIKGGRAMEITGYTGRG